MKKGCQNRGICVIVNDSQSTQLPFGGVFVNWIMNECG